MKAKTKGNAKAAAKLRTPVLPAPDLNDDDGEPEAGEQIEISSDAELERAAAELGAGAGGRVFVTKLEPKDQAGECDPYAAAEYSIERLRADWGDGKFSIVIRRPDGAIYKRGMLQLAPRAARSHQAPPVDTDQLRRQAVEDYQRSMAPIIEMQKTMMHALAGRPAAPAVQPLELLEIVTKVMEIRGPRERGSEFDAVMKGIKLASELRGSGEGGEAGIADVFVEFLRSWRAGQVNAPPSDPPRPALPAAPTPAPAASEGDAMTRFVAEMIAKQAVVFLRGAEAGSDPGVYAQLLLDQVPDQFLSMVGEQLKRADWFEQLERLDPRISPHREWLGKVREQFMLAISAEAPTSS